MRSNQEVNCLCAIALALGVIEGIAMGLPDDQCGKRLKTAAATIGMRLADLLDSRDGFSTSNSAEQPEALQ